MKPSNILLGMFAILTAATATRESLAVTVFSDTFQGDLSQWTTVGSAVIVNDPLVAGGKALAFSRLGSGGDLFSPFIPGTGAGPYTIGYDYLGACGSTSNCGGFLGVDQPGERWLASDTGFGGLADVYADTGAWQFVTFSFTATGAFDLKLEDFAGSANAFAYTAAGGASAYFKNLQVVSGDVALTDIVGASSIGEPATLAILGFGVAGMGVVRRRTTA